eukprot:CAMPEP_0170471732 /NCGR_PEP_ID=MMETSP0123-20130129/13899_1 /TAXON_ID=182087 /ORGANISM="Favella ehrenbergii, Strain Fehren 1" /LENGTH=93 /DNA_ID=CAMNT_0010739569 /DNA_START=501 /DNA_END=782 /DNA_ORIENTATION=-
MRDCETDRVLLQAKQKKAIEKMGAKVTPIAPQEPMYVQDFDAFEAFDGRDSRHGIGPDSGDPKSFDPHEEPMLMAADPVLTPPEALTNGFASV